MTHREVVLTGFRRIFRPERWDLTAEYGERCVVYGRFFLPAKGAHFFTWRRDSIVQKEHRMNRHDIVSALFRSAAFDATTGVLELE